MRKIYPVGTAAVDGGGGAVDLAASYAYPSGWADSRAGRPTAWVRANMVASIDGAATVKGLSGGLSSEDDRQLFHMLRSLADVILVGAGTVRAEGYGPARPRDEWARMRADRPPSPPIAVVTGMLDLDLSSPLFTAAPAYARTIALTTEAAPPDRRAQAAQNADVVIAGAHRVEMASAISALASRGLRRVLVEGGPHLLGQLAAADLLDEFCLTVSPLVAGADAFRTTAGSTLPSPQRLHLAHVLEAAGSLFCRYVRVAP